jgi:hypothetical protein
MALKNPSKPWPPNSLKSGSEIRAALVFDVQVLSGHMMSGKPTLTEDHLSDFMDQLTR